MLKLATADADLPEADNLGPWNPDTESPVLGRLECAAILSDIIRATVGDFITVDAKGAIHFKPIGPHTPHAGAIKRIKYDERRDRKGQLRQVITGIEMADTVKAIGLLCEIMGHCDAANRETTARRMAAVRADPQPARPAVPLMPQPDVSREAVAA